MTLFICCYHFCFWNYGYNITFTTLREFSGSLAMSLFFLISGFLLYQNANTKEEINRKVHKRFYSLFIPFVIWNAITVIRVIYIKRSFPFTFANFLSWFFTGPADGPIWYLLAIYLLSLFAPIIVKFKHKKVLTTSLFSVLLIYLYLRNAGLFPYPFMAEDWWWYWNTIGYLPYFLIGSYTGLYFKDFIANRDYKVITHIISLVIFLSLSYIKCFTLLITSGYVGFITNILICLSFWFMLPNCWFKSNLNLVSQNSFFLYVMHYPFLIPLADKITRRIFRNFYFDFWPMILLYILALVLMFLICWAIVSLIKLILIKSNKTFMILSGNRVQNDFAIKFQERKLKKQTVQEPENYQTNQENNKNQDPIEEKNSQKKKAKEKT